MHAESGQVELLKLRRGENARSFWELQARRLGVAPQTLKVRKRTCALAGMLTKAGQSSSGNCGKGLPSDCCAFRP